jgi:hypothetical protein
LPEGESVTRGAKKPFGRILSSQLFFIVRNLSYFCNRVFDTTVIFELKSAAKYVLRYCEVKWSFCFLRGSDFAWFRVRSRVQSHCPVRQKVVLPFDPSASRCLTVLNRFCSGGNQCEAYLCIFAENNGFVPFLVTASNSLPIGKARPYRRRSIGWEMDVHDLSQ